MLAKSDIWIWGGVLSNSVNNCKHMKKLGTSPYEIISVSSSWSTKFFVHFCRPITQLFLAHHGSAFGLAALRIKSSQIENCKTFTIVYAQIWRFFNRSEKIKLYDTYRFPFFISINASFVFCAFSLYPFI